MYIAQMLYCGNFIPTPFPKNLAFQTCLHLIHNDCFLKLMKEKEEKEEKEKEEKKSAKCPICRRKMNCLFPAKLEEAELCVWEQMANKYLQQQNQNDIEEPVILLLKSLISFNGVWDFIFPESNFRERSNAHILKLIKEMYQKCSEQRRSEIYKKVL